jgi:AGZA family xanthine/uracil permease-like MFS transporter
MDGATTGTILVFVVGTLLMAFYANLPFIVGPGIGGSVLVGVTLAGSEGIGWQTGLGIACWSGILFFLLPASACAKWSPVRCRSRSSWG